MTDYTLLISDLHLQPETPEITERFFRFIHDKAWEADALYILGDLFELWIGDDDQTRFHQQIADCLKKLTTHGVPVYFMPGNRDWLIGRTFERQAGMTRIPDPYLTKIYETSVLLSHGDALCLDDKRHQHYRRLALNPLTQKIFLALPLSLRRTIAKKLRSNSQKNHARNAIADVCESAVLELMQKNSSHLLIHGHTHRPNIHDCLIHHKPAQRVVLGAWHDDADYVCFFKEGGYQLTAMK